MAIRWKKQKWILWTLRLLGAVTVLGLLAILLAPWFINLDAVKQEVLATVSQKFGSLTYRSVELPLFPKPHVILHEVGIDRDDAVRFSAGEMKIVPRFLPLFQGHVLIQKIRVISPQLKVSLPASRPDSALIAEKQPQQTKARIRSVLSTVFTDGEDGLEIEIRNGRVFLEKKSFGTIFMANLSMDLAFQDGEILFQTRSQKASTWLRLSANGHLNAKTLSGNAKIRIEEFTPMEIARSFLPDWLSEQTQGRLDLDLDIQNTPNSLQAAIHADNLQLAVGPDILTSGITMDAAIENAGQKWITRLGNIGREGTAFSASGRLTCDASKPRSFLELRTQNIQIEPWSRALTLLFPSHRKNLQDVFDILQGGSVPDLQLSAAARDVQGLFDETAIQVSATIADGKIHVQTPDLQISEVSGDVSIREGLLEAKNLRGRIGDATASRGQLTLGFTETLAPFYLETDITTDLAMLPPVLKQVSDSDAFIAELEKIDRVQGTASGTLILEGDTDQLNGTVRAHEILLAGNYRRIPYPVDISHGNVDWKGQHLRIRNMQGRIGKSTVSNLHADVDWSGEETTISIFSTAARVDVTEVNNWLYDYRPIREFIKGAEFSGGIIDLKIWHLTGPALQPEKWQALAQGRAAAVHVALPAMRAPLFVQHAEIRTREKMGPTRGWDDWILEGSEIECADSRIALSGNIRFTENIASLDLEAAADKISWNAWIENIRSEGTNGTDRWPLPVEGVVKLQVGVFEIKPRRWESVYADILLAPENIRILVPQAELCGIQTPVDALIQPGTWNLQMDLSSKQKDIESAIECIWKKKKWMTGLYEITGQIMIEQAPNRTEKESSGSATIHAAEGRIYRSTVLAKVLAFLNVTEIFKGKMPDLFQEGFAYETARATCILQDENIRIDGLVIKGASMDIFVSGTVGLESGLLDLDLLVAPLKTVDSIVRKVPIINQILDGNLVTIPVKVTGRAEDPKVVPMEINAVGSGLLRLLDRTIQLPAKMMEPFMEEDEPTEQ